MSLETRLQGAAWGYGSLRIARVLLRLWEVVDTVTKVSFIITNSIMIEIRFLRPQRDCVDLCDLDITLWPLRLQNYVLKSGIYYSQSGTASLILRFFSHVAWQWGGSSPMWPGNEEVLLSGGLGMRFFSHVAWEWGGSSPMWPGNEVLLSSGLGMRFSRGLGMRLEDYGHE